MKIYIEIYRTKSFKDSSKHNSPRKAVTFFENKGWGCMGKPVFQKKIILIIKKTKMLLYVVLLVCKHFAI